MNPNVVIRSEMPIDAEAIARVTELAFRSHPHSHHNEPFIIQALRRAGALTVSLVGESERQVVGHIAFSPVAFSSGLQNWYGLGPMAVAPEMQGQGIGTSLVRHGLKALAAFGAAGCVLLGDPAFYGRFGFVSRSQCVLEGMPPEYFLSLAFGGHPAEGRVTYHEAFMAQGS